MFSETEGVEVYYTLNGSKPEPFQSIGPAARATLLYREPFTLPAGRRTIKAVAVAELVALFFYLFLASVVVRLLLLALIPVEWH